MNVMIKAYIIILALFGMRIISYAQDDSTLNKFERKNNFLNKKEKIEFIHKQNNNTRLNTRRIYDAHWATYGGILLGGGTGYIIGYLDAKNDPPGILGPQWKPAALSVIGGIIGAFTGYIIDELVFPELFQSRAARITLQGNTIAISISL